jgi:hypothetical protein
MDNLRSSRSSQRPNCWGNPNAYDQYDPECSGCRYQHSCRSEVENEEQPVSIPVRRHGSRSYSRSDDRPRGGVEVSKKGELVSEGESAFDRFFKDAAAGALRGCFYEMYEFWRRYRIP